MANYQNYPTELFDNLKQIYHASAEKYGEKPLFQQKRNGVYENFSFRRYRNDVDALGTALLAHELEGCVLLVGENSYEWVTAYMAVICGVGTVVPIDKECDAKFLSDVAERCGACAAIYSARCADRVGQLDPSVERIAFSDLDELIEEGKLRIRAGDRTYLDADIDPRAMAVLLFTSGTADEAKGVMLSHRNLCFNLSEMCKMVYVDQNDVFLSVLPLHHAYECTCGFLCSVYRGCTVAFGEGLRYVTRNMREVRPTVMLGVPLLIETVYQKIQINIRRHGMEKKVRTMIGLTESIGSEKLRIAAKRRLFSDIHKSFGGRLRLLVSGGSTVDPNVLRGLRELGILAIQGYGLTECAPIAAINRDRFYNDRSAGMATPNTLLDIYDIQDDGVGEVRFRGDNVMLGYYDAPELTAEAIRDGWFYTGDLGHIDSDGFLYITGRKKNLIVTASGKTVSPEELETLLDRTRFVKESVVVGCYNEEKKDRDIVALIHPDYDALAERFGTGLTSGQLDLEMRKAISEVNGGVQPHKRITDYLLRTEAFPKNTSRKIKRAGLAEAALAQYREKREKR